MPNYKIVTDPYTSNPASIFWDVVGFIPIDEANTDYQAYLVWLAEGNTAEPWNPEPASVDEAQPSNDAG